MNHSTNPTFVLWIVAVLGIWVSVAVLSSSARDARPEPTFAAFLVELERGELREVVLRTRDNSVRVTPAGGPAYEVGYPPEYSGELVERLRSADVRFDVKPGGNSALAGVLRLAVPVALLVGVWLLVRRRTGVGGRAGAFGRAPARQPAEDGPKTTFGEVAGLDEALEELREITEVLADPSRFESLGARIPKGVLLSGPPGTGKTLLARAVAGEAGVPFFSISGSDFVEMFVGVGASRVRDLFERAKQQAPAIVFMDEIDAVGRQRGAGVGGGHDEREQTLNQLLVAMDGFEPRARVIVIAATNRPDILDPALLRPGRFDRQIIVDRPDRPGRREILKVHTRGKPLAAEVDLDALAGQTAGFTGADLANLVNEAALLAARNSGTRIAQPELEEGIMRVIAGPERRSRVLSERERRVTAYHEMGHAIVGHFLEHADPVHRISIIARGQAHGYTISLPSEDTFLTTKAELSDTIAMTLGGRAAEEIVFGEITTGASNDLEKVTATAKQMVMRFGMSETLGPRVFGRDQGQPFLGRSHSSESGFSGEIAREIDDEIRRIIDEAHTRAEHILLEHRDALTRISEILLDRETIERAQFEALVAGNDEHHVFEDARIVPLRRGDPERAGNGHDAPAWASLVAAHDVAKMKATRNAVPTTWSIKGPTQLPRYLAGKVAKIEKPPVVVVGGRQLLRSIGRGSDRPLVPAARSTAGRRAAPRGTRRPPGRRSTTRSAASRS
jgi:cell division protease FtsH